METPSKSHIGRKISRIRELRGMKQEALAQALGVSQQTVSTLENSEEIDEKRLKDVAEALGISAEGIRNFSEEAVINYFNSFNDADFSNSQGVSFGNFGPSHCTFNPLDKLVEVYEENKRLYERLLESEKEKVRYLEKMMDK
ncbi:helix-turn-helix transcriptional regulator [Flavobacterium sp. MAH-1]|uniref:Helix-turn-helix transcriptional regulator n=1 Tax=Flavobacterium agri TaxID=2743471 RepID=A0A7Y8Y3M8_9FLAO|nr:helix-turn-helix transcriptional regulator [Flavobacterium agri]NUY81743.1 helix-turn-helix transcriptional regulator [Flavobacterium agri]NYA71767.1 helix-turn-helix transcriptional regulator [Flavobacterium agri]